jgi:diguanylate cyclase (GGDEF)-like protein/PAS domain S-box-containing protein
MSPTETRRAGKARPAKTGRPGEERYRFLLEHLPVGVYRTTRDGRILEANPALAHILGYSLSELKKLNVADLYVNRAQRDDLLPTYELEGSEFVELRLKRKDGRRIWGRDYCRAAKGAGGEVVFYDGILFDITQQRMTSEKLTRALDRLKASNAERKRMIQKLESLSLTDDLTGLANRRGFRVLAEQYLAVSSRNKAKSFLLYVDMDYLKRINDMFGHHVGDKALVRMAQILKSTFRMSDIMGRMGGDEFAVFPIESTPAGMEIILSRLLKNIDEANRAPDAPFKLSVSVGVAGFDPEYPVTIDELLVRADALMYEEKRKKEDR